MPKALLNKLPDKARDIYEAAWESAIEQGRDEETAAKIAIGAVKRAGYSKDDDTGLWHKMYYVPMHITKAAMGNDGVMRWAATTSKFTVDDQADEVTPIFYKHAIAQVESGKRPNPVLCVSHIDKGKPADDWVPGDATELYIDGDLPKAKGTFRDTPLGKAAFEAVRGDYGKPDDEKIRISLGFFDEGSELRKTEKADGSVATGRRYLKGWIKHLALTRVPVVKETEISVMEAKAMVKTKQEDAASIVGAEIAEELVRSDKAELTEGLVLKGQDEGETAPEVEEKAEQETQTETKPEEKAESYRCECPECGHKMTSKAHCKDVECPECGATMRREERPGPGKKSEAEVEGEKAEVEPVQAPSVEKQDGTGERRNQIKDVLQQLADLLDAEWTEDTEVANAAAAGNKGTNPPRAEPADKSEADPDAEPVTEPEPDKAKALAAQEPTVPEAVEVAAFVDDFATRVKATLLAEGDRRDKFATLQNYINTFGEGVVMLVKGSTPPSSRDIADVVSEAVRAAVEPLQNQLAGVKAELDDLKGKAAVLDKEPVKMAPQPQSLDTRARVITQQSTPFLGPTQKARTAKELAYLSTAEGRGY